MLKNPSKATRFNFDTHDCTFYPAPQEATAVNPALVQKGGIKPWSGVHVQFILQEGWLARREGYKVSLAGLFHHICHPKCKTNFATVG